MDIEHPRPTKKRQLAAEERQRAVRACVECRRLKEKCEDGIPCRRCRHLRRPCELNPPTAAVSKRPSDIAGSLKELRDRLQYMGTILRHHFPDLALDVDSLRRTCDDLTATRSRLDHIETTTTAVEVPEPPVTESPSTSPGIEDEKCTIDYVDGTTVHYSGEFSHWNYSMHIKRNIDELMASSNVANLEHVTHVPDFIRVGEADPDSTSISDIVALLPPRPVAGFLIDVFFKHATSFYYYVDRPWLTGILGQLYSDAGRLSSKDVTAACVVLMVLAVGTQYVHLESPKQRNKSSGNASGSIETSGSWELDIGAAFYRQVARLLSEVIHAGSLLSVQVFLLLGLYTLPIDASGLGYIYLNLAIKVAIQNGMHRKTTRSDIDASMKEIRRRVWWTAYCMERKIGVYHGRPTSIVRSDIDADTPGPLSTDVANDKSFNPSGIIESIALTGQAEAFLREISRLQTCAKSEVGPILSQIKSMKDNMGGRWSPPPHNTSSTSATVQAGQATSRADLHSRLECCLLHMFIGRPFILAHRQTRAGVRSNSSVGAARLPETGQTKVVGPQTQWTFLVQDCVAAAKEVIDICHTMQTGPMGLAKSSYTEYSSCRASLLVLIAYSICYRTNEFSETLHRGLESIREMASVGDSARSEVSLLETLEAALHRLHVFDPTPVQTTSTDEEDVSQGGYEGFVNWYTQLTGSANSRVDPTSAYRGDALVAKTPDRGELGTSSGKNRNDTATATSQDNLVIEDYPFDFDLLNSDGNVAFFTPDFNEHGNPERELFENLLWVPR